MSINLQRLCEELNCYICYFTASSSLLYTYFCRYNTKISDLERKLQVRTVQYFEHVSDVISNNTCYEPKIVSP
jgi:hypothetical protein